MSLSLAITAAAFAVANAANPVRGPITLQTEGVTSKLFRKSYYNISPSPLTVFLPFFIHSQARWMH
jgi:hypothetical protein